MRREIAKRGPDGSNELVIQVNDFSLTFIGSVLALRGRQLVAQPLQDDINNVLLWNGEVFGGIKVSEEENDTAVLLALLSGCNTTTEIVELLETIEGPYAFVYWQASNKRLFFGKDKLGRRSLLLHRPSSSSEPLILSSVAALPQEIYEPTTSAKPDKEKSGDEEQEEEDEDETGHFWEELSTQSLYCIDFAPKGDCQPEPEASAEAAKEDLHSGVSLTKLGNRPIFPFGRRTLLEPPQSPSEDHSVQKTDELQALTSEQEQDLRETSSDEAMQRDWDATVSAFLEVLKRSVSKRVSNLPPGRAPGSRVGVLFSGGLDSIVLARLADLYVPMDEPIDLLNVAFAANQAQAKPAPVRQNKSKKSRSHKTNGDQSEGPPSSSSASLRSPYDAVPDRQTGIRGWCELRSVSPSRRWNFVEVNVLADELHEHHNQIIHLLHPSTSLMDHSIAAATWFAARGQGVIRSDAALLASVGVTTESVAASDTAEIERNKETTGYLSPARVLLIGSGADEQFGGYGRHRTAFRRGGWVALQEELEKDTTRIWKRNMGRDDRVISSTGRESRIPYLDEEVVAFLNATPLWQVCDMRLQPGVGDKALLREAGRRLGLTASTRLVKRAIQFGSRIAKVSHPNQSEGGRRKIKGADAITLSLRAPQPQPSSFGV